MNATIAGPHKGASWSVSLEFGLQNLWVGAYWKVRGPSWGKRMLDVWICFLPCLPIHLAVRVGPKPEWGGLR